MCMAGLLSFTSPLPQRLVFGSGSLDRLGALATSLGESALVVLGGGSLRGSGGLQRLEDSLCAADLTHEVFDGVPAEPTLDWVDEGRERCATMGADMVIGVGGGSVLDVAKAIGALAWEARPTVAYHRGEAEISHPGLPIIAAPTTAGTGAEVTPNSVLTDPDLHVKASLRGGDLMPQLAIVDPTLTVTCPPEQTAYSGLDAIVQAIESYTSKGAGPYSDALALRALELMAPVLKRAVEDGEDLAAREAMALGSTMAGMALACARLGLAHGLAHPVGHLLGLPHGRTCGLLMPAVMAFNLPAARAKYATAARALGLKAEGEEEAVALVSWFRDLAEELGVSGTLAGQGLEEGHYERIIEEALASGSTRHNPREVTAEDLLQMLQTLRAG